MNIHPAVDNITKEYAIKSVILKHADINDCELMSV